MSTAHCEGRAGAERAGKRYSPACTRLLSQYMTMLKLVGPDVPSIEEFMSRYRVRSSWAMLLRDGILTTLGCTLDGLPCCTTQTEGRRAGDR